MLVVSPILALLAACSSLGEGAGGEPTLTAQQTQGKRLFDQYCETCHARSTDAVVMGPSLAGIEETAAERVDGMSARAYIRQSITDPSAYVVDGFDELMPTTLQETLSEEELDALVAYLLTLE